MNSPTDPALSSSAEAALPGELSATVMALSNGSETAIKNANSGCGPAQARC